MGAWGTDSFQNDWALDWLASFRESGDVAFVHGTLDCVVKHGGTKTYPASIILKLLGRSRRTDWLKARVAAQALAAAEVVTAWLGHPSPNLPGDLSVWLQEHTPSSQTDLVLLAQKAVSIVKTNSELKDLWEEGDAQEWKNMVEDLEQRLGQPSASAS